MAIHRNKTEPGRRVSEECPAFDSQGIRYGINVRDTQILLDAVHRADAFGMEIRQPRDLFLGETCRKPHLTNPASILRIDVAGLSHRFLEAGSGQEAAAQVRDAIINVLDIRATTAVRQIADAFEKAGPLQRKEILANIDGLNDPESRDDAKVASRRLETLEKQERQQRVTRVRL